jgi:hypothetical protein
LLLAACGNSRPQTESVESLMPPNPVRLKALRAQCAGRPAGQGEDALCNMAAEATRRRFMGQPGHAEYQTLADLPPIPPSFDEPDGAASAPED